MPVGAVEGGTVGLHSTAATQHVRLNDDGDQMPGAVVEPNLGVESSVGMCDGVGDGGDVGL